MSDAIAEILKGLRREDEHAVAVAITARLSVKELLNALNKTWSKAELRHLHTELGKQV